MKKIKTWIALLLVITMFGSLAVGCGKDATKDGEKDPSQNEANNEGDTPKEIKEFSAFFAVPGTELPDDNRLMNKIAEVTGAKAKMTWLTGQTAAERIGVMIAGGDYPDFIVGATGTPALMEAGALVAIDEYWDNYPNIKNYLSEEEWNMVRSEDGHIYLIPQFGIIQGKDTSTSHSDEALWIQKDVLVWANYPEINSLDEYFDLIADYVKANPTINGQDTIGFSMSTEDWRYFGIENPPMFLMGYPNDGAAIVDAETETAYNYDVLPEAKEYYQKLNEVYNSGLMDPETFTLSYDQYIAKLSTGRVVGILDQQWNFGTAETSLKSQGLYERTYVPLPITFSDDIKDRWYSPSALDVSNGLSITTSCEDIEGAMKFVNDLLSPEVMTLRFWGEEGVDYQVGDDGLFYRTEEQRANAENQDWATANLSSYSYFPHFEGMLADNINTILPAEQPSEFYATLSDVEKKILDGYGYDNFLDFLTTDWENEPWYPMWSYTNTWTSDTDYGVAKAKISDMKHEWIPKAVMSSTTDFDKVWDEYQSTYKDKVDVDAYEEALTEEVRRRAAVARGEE